MDISKEELQELIKIAVSEALNNFFDKNQKEEKTPQHTPEAKSPTYQEVFDDTMAKVARGELTAKQAGEIISKAYATPVTPTYTELSDKLHEFKSYMKGWEEELDVWMGKSESTIDMMERMKTKVDTKEQEAKLYADMKKIQEVEARAKAEASLEEMKAKLRND